jgi:hypothetical protein
VALAGIARHEVEATVRVTVTKKALVVHHRNLQAGPAQFVVSNKGPSPHVLSISGPGLKRAVSRKVPAGKSATLTVTLRKGVYMLADRPASGSQRVRWLLVSPAVSSTGTSREVQPFPDPVPQECD